MKYYRKILIATAVLPACVFAQSSAEVYGRIDLSLNHLKITSEGGRNTVSTDTSWLGFRGTEDMGGGLSTFWKMESLVNADTGAVGGTLNIGNGAKPVVATPTGQFFNRESHVGLRSTSWGQFSLGTHWAPGIALTARTDPFQRSQLGGQWALLQGPGSRGYFAQFVNSAQYVTPNIAGFIGKITLQIPEGTWTKNQGLAIDYLGSDRLYVGLAYDHTQLNLSAVALGKQPDNYISNLGIGATYRMDIVKLFAYAQQNRVLGLPTVNGYDVGIAVPLGNGEIRTSYSRTGNPGKEAALRAVGYNHFLTKRTQLYTTVARLDNSSSTKFSMSPAYLSDGVVPQANGRDTAGFQIGMRHTF